MEMIHDALVMKLWPGTDPISEGESRNTDLLESGLGRPFQTLMGEDAYPTLQEKAIALFHSLISNHPFWNGNKRTAVISFDHFLMGNYHFSVISNKEMYILAERTASYRERGISHENAIAEIRVAIQDRIVSYDALWNARDKDTSFGPLHETLSATTDWIRHHEHNSIIPAT